MAHKTTTLLAALQASKSMQPRAAVAAPTNFALMVQPKPLPPSSTRAELSREVRIALDSLSACGLASPRSPRHAATADPAPFICG